MVFKEFEHKINKDDKIKVRFYLEFNGQAMQITDINIHAPINCGLPSHPQLRQYNGETVFYVENDTDTNGKIKGTGEYIINELVRSLIASIYKIADENKPAFF